MRTKTEAINTTKEVTSYGKLQLYTLRAVHRMIRQQPSDDLVKHTSAVTQCFPTFNTPSPLQALDYYCISSNAQIGVKVCAYV